MSKLRFAEDPSSRKVLKVLLILQLAGALLVPGISRLHFTSLACAISCLTLLAFLAGLVWLHGRYRQVPLIRERDRLRNLLARFDKHVRSEGRLIRAAIQERERLLQAEKEEIDRALQTLQAAHLEEGLEAASLREAFIPGIDVDLKERLAGQGIVNAARLSDRLYALPGLDETQTQALLNWRHEIVERLEISRPRKITEAQLEAIQQKYQALQEKNGLREGKARSSQELLVYELMSLRPRLRELAPLTFPRYFTRSLSPHGRAGGLLAAGLVALQLISSSAGATLAAGSLQDTLGETGLARRFEELSRPLRVSPSAAGPAACIPPDTLRETGLVVGVLDGATIDVRLNEQVVRVRYIGVNSPGADQPVYPLAAAYNQGLVGDKTVTLVRDTSEADSLGQLLRYVIVGDIFVNAALLQQGYAHTSADAPDTACRSTFEAAQRAAQTTKVGLWLSTPEGFIAPVTGGEPTAE